MTPSPGSAQAYRGKLLHFLADPGDGCDAQAAQFFDDGLLVVESGLVRAAGSAAALLPTLGEGVQHRRRLGPAAPAGLRRHAHPLSADRRDRLTPGRSCSTGWSTTPFRPSGRFADPAHAAEVADFFLDELLRNGTTTALVFGTVHAHSVDVFFEAGAGPQDAHDRWQGADGSQLPGDPARRPRAGYRDSAALIENWHGRGRLGYAITPRFAVTSRDAQLSLAGELAREYPRTRIHSHVAENVHEVAWARELFPWSRSYLDVYERFGLLRERAVYAHCIHLDDPDRRRMAHTRRRRRGLPDLQPVPRQRPVRLRGRARRGDATGLAHRRRRWHQLQPAAHLSEAYKVAQMHGQRLVALARASISRPSGGARAGAGRRIGNFSPARKPISWCSISPSTPLLARRRSGALTPPERAVRADDAGDDRAVAATYVLGEPVYRTSKPMLR